MMSERIGRALERQGLWMRDLENNFLVLDSHDGESFHEALAACHDDYIDRPIVTQVTCGAFFFRPYKLLAQSNAALPPAAAARLTKVPHAMSSTDKPSGQSRRVARFVRS